MFLFITLDNSCKLLWALPLKNENSQIKTQEVLYILTKSERKPFKRESDRGADWYISVFQNLLKSKNIQHNSRYTDEGPSVVEQVIRSVHNLLKKTVFEKGNALWLSELPSVFQKYNNSYHKSIKTSPSEASRE